MAWQRLRPANTGGGRKQDKPAARLIDGGQFVLNHVEVNVEERRIRLLPTTPGNAGGFALSGGGNSPHRISLRQFAGQHPEMAGDYSVVRIAGGIECRRVDE